LRKNQKEQRKLLHQKLKRKNEDKDMSQINRIAELIKNANNITVLTGAGMSTESGIPDFRSRTGIYSSNPQDILSVKYLDQHPKEFWDFMKQYLNWTNVEPNIGHKILADWETKGLVKNIITQNIDGLHQKAGSKNVLQVHGTMKTAFMCHSIARSLPLINLMLSESGALLLP
jgi:NAD-dependent deacetylase